MKQGPKELLIDTENSPMLSYVFGLWDQNIGLNQIYKDWHFLSCAVKWRGDKKIHYMDQRNSRKMENDKALCKWIISWLNKADIVYGHNLIGFDMKRIRARCAIWGLKPPKPVKLVDTLKIARKLFGFTSNKQAYLSKALCGIEKDEHREFSGFELWSECLKGNPRAWAAIRKYNQADIIGLEGVVDKLVPWDGGTHSVYLGKHACRCGSRNLQKRGYRTTKTGKFAQYQCQSCGSWSQDGINVLSQTRRLTR